MPESEHSENSSGYSVPNRSEPSPSPSPIREYRQPPMNERNPDEDEG